MIALRIVREPTDRGATLGALYLNDVWQCWTLEDAIREPADAVITPASVLAWKVAGKTAIPSGRYAVVMEWSPKFATYLPELKGVPAFSETKFHAGNTQEDTDGCILVGLNRGDRKLYDSRLALQGLLRRIGHINTSGPMFVDVENPPARYLETLADTTRRV